MWTFYYDVDSGPNTVAILRGSCVKDNEREKLIEKKSFNDLWTAGGKLTGSIEGWHK